MHNDHEEMMSPLASILLDQVREMQEMAFRMAEKTRRYARLQELMDERAAARAGL